MRVLEGGSFIGGSFFEEQFAQSLNIPYCVGTGNGTDALFLILKALDLQPGDEVIVPAWGCFPTAEAVTLAGGKLVFAEVDAARMTLDPQQATQKITSRTRAIIAVHLYGQPADLTAIASICEQHKIYLVEDCAQAHYTQFHGRYVGTFGVAAAFSFYPTKNLGAYGDAGCVVTQHEALAVKIRRLANHGALHRTDHLLEGTNSRIDTWQAAVLAVKLRHLPAWTARRIALASRYQHALRGISDLILPHAAADSIHTFHLFCIRTPHRDALKKFLREAGIETIIHYPQGLPFTPAYAYRRHTETDYPVTARLQQEVLSLPLYPELTDSQLEYVISTVKDFFDNHVATRQ